MTPSQLAKESESSHQQAVFCWANMAARHGIEAADDERCYKEPGYAVSKIKNKIGNPNKISHFNLPLSNNDFPPINSSSSLCKTN